MLDGFFSWLMETFSVKTPAALVTMVGAVSHYLYQIQMGYRSFTFLRFLLTCLLGMYMGMLVGNFLPDTLEYRDGWLSLAGFSMYQVYFVLDTKMTAWVQKTMSRYFNLPK